MSHRSVFRWWLIPVAIAIVVGHLFVPYLFLHAGTSVAIISGVLGVMLVKHLGIGAVVLRSLSGRFKRRN